MVPQKVCIVGLGYVGLPLAVLCASRGHSVSALDLDEDIIRKTNAGKSHIKDPVLQKAVAEVKGKILASTNPEKVISGAEIVIVCVPTPVDEDKKPDLSSLKKACETISRHLSKGSTVVVESTVYPGTMEGIVLPIFKKEGFTSEQDVFLLHCPERIDPGNAEWHIGNIPRVLGGFGREGTEKGLAFYRSIIDAPVKEMPSVREAEAVKVVENSFRDVNIAFVNELAKSFTLMGIDIKKVIEGASTKPFGYMPFYPGPGAGGHCIPVDPYYLIKSAHEKGFNHRFLLLAREINDSMANYIVGRVAKALSLINLSPEKAKVTVLGIAYKKNIDDLRESPALRIIEALKQKGFSVTIFDPLITSNNTSSSLEEAISDKDCIILATDHDLLLKQLIPSKLKGKGTKIFMDARNALNPADFKNLGITYIGIGR